MTSSYLMRAEKAIGKILSSGEPLHAAEVGLALQELLDVIRSLERRVMVMEANTHSFALTQERNAYGRLVVGCR